MEMTAKDAGSILSHMDMEIGVLMQQRSAIKYIGAVIKLGEEKQKVIDTFEDTKATLALVPPKSIPTAIRGFIRLLSIYKVEYYKSDGGNLLSINVGTNPVLALPLGLIEG